MPKLFYWRSAIGDPFLLEIHRDAINDVLNGTCGPGNLEKLTGYRVYSLRLNEKGRLLFTTHEVCGQSYLLVLEHLPNHEYSRSRFLKSGVLDRYIEQNSTDLTAAAVHSEDFEHFDGSFKMSDASADANSSPIPLDYFNEQFIELNPTQECARKMVLPGVISGIAGSGKSCTVLSILIEEAGQHQQTVLYVTKSKRLANEMSRVWTAQLCQQMNPDLVEFKTYTELLSETLGNNPHGITILSSSADKVKDVDFKTMSEADSSPINEDLNHFQSWYRNFISLYHRELKLKKMSTSPAPIDRTLDAGTAYREFRICSAYKEQDYCELGDKNTSLTDKQQKKWLYRAYVSYLKFLEDNRLMHPSFAPLRRATPYFRVIVDEAQDFSQLQLDSLLALAQDNAIVYCMDSHQMLFDSISSRALLLQRLFDKFGKPASHTTLEISYRCPANVARAVNVIIRLKQHTLGGTVDKFESQAIHAITDPSKGPGNFYLLTPEELLQTQWFKTLVKNKDFAIVTTEKNREAVCQWLLEKNIGQPIIYTAAEIKGREYRVILALNMCSDTKILRRIPAGIAAKDDSTIMHRAKNKGADKYSDADDAVFLTEMNELHVACTRASETLIVCDEKNLFNSALLDALKAVETLGESLFMSSAKQSSSDEWMIYAKALYNDGQHRNSEAIFLSNVYNGKEAFASFVAHRQTEWVEKSSRIMPASKPIESAKAAPIVSTTNPIELSVRVKKINATQPEAKKIVTTPLKSPLLSSAQKGKTKEIKPQAKSELEILLPKFTMTNLLTLLLDKPTILIHKLIAEKPDCLHYIISNDDITTEFIKCIRNLRDFREKMLTTGFIQQLILLDPKFIPALRMNHLIESIVDTEPKLMTQANIALFLAKIQSAETFCKFYSEGVTLIKSKNNNCIPDCISEEITIDEAIRALHQIHVLNDRFNSSLAYRAAKKNAITILVVLGGLGVDLKQTETEVIPPIFVATHFGSVEALIVLHSFGVSLDYTRADGTNLAHVATEFGHVQVLKLLHNYGVNLNQAKIENEVTPALFAAQTGDLSILKLLHECGVNLAQIRKSDGITLAFVAAQRGYVAVLHLLASLNIPLNQPMNNGATPLIVATQQGHSDVLECLYENGVDLAQRGIRGQTLVHIGVEFGYLKILQLLHRCGVNLDFARDDGATPALLSAQKGQVDSLEMLIACGVNPNQRRKIDGATLAILATQCGHLAILKVLHNHHISLDQPMNNGATPAFVAAGKRDIPILEFLYHNGVNLAQGRKDDGATIAILAAQEGYIPILQMLHNYNIPLDQPMNDGTTPAYIATEQGHLHVLRFLHSNGVDLTKTRADGMTLIIFAAHHKQKDILTMLQQCGKERLNTLRTHTAETNIIYSTNLYGLFAVPQANPIENPPITFPPMQENKKSL